MMTEPKTETVIYYAPADSGLLVVKHALQGVVATLLSRAAGVTAIGRGPFDPDLITACWLLNIRSTPYDTLPGLMTEAVVWLERVRAVLGEAAGWLKGYALYELTENVRAGLVGLVRGGCHA